jgi:hypothetical protein
MIVKENLVLEFKCVFRDRNDLEIFSNNIRGFVEGSLQSLSKDSDIQLTISDSYTKSSIILENLNKAIEQLS